MSQSLSIADDRAAALAEMFRILGDASRLKIVLACLADPVSVGEIALGTALSPSLVSHHLRLLRTARLVRAERRGRQIYYVATDRHIRSVVTDMLEHLGEAAP